MMLGVPYLKFAVARSGDWIDRQAASASNSTIASITALKESGSVDISNPAGWEQSAIAMYYKTLIRYVCVNLHKQVTQEARLPQLKDPIKVVISGGTSRIRGFKQAFEGELKSLEWPFVVSDVVTASDPMNAVANGCLVAAKLAEKNRKA
jgi:activator of 2-hydroxyglutaryl-CoA dehydratase